jgi:hypothetical protein
LLLEPQRTNLCIRSEEFDTWTDVSTCNVTANTTIAPDGATTADTLTATLTASARRRDCTFTGDGEKAVAVFLKAGTSGLVRVALVDGTAPATRHSVNVTWTAGVPALTTNVGAGTLYPVQAYGNGWYRIMFSATGVVAANSNSVRIFPDVTSGTGTVLAWGAQAENAVVPSSYIPTAATTITRNADSLYWALASLVPREMTVYVRIINVGAFILTAATRGAWHIGGTTAGANPRMSGFGAASGNQLVTLYHDGTTQRTALASPSPVPVLADVVEGRSVLNPDWTVTSGVSVNGGAEVTATSAASGPAAAFNLARFWLGSTPAAEQPAAYTNVAIATGTRSRAEMRGLAGVV